MVDHARLKQPKSRISNWQWLSYWTDGNWWSLYALLTSQMCAAKSRKADGTNRNKLMMMVICVSAQPGAARNDVYANWLRGLVQQKETVA